MHARPMAITHDIVTGCDLDGKPDLGEPKHTSSLRAERLALGPPTGQCGCGGTEIFEPCPVPAAGAERE
jgi:hypothetical protein